MKKTVKLILSVISLLLVCVLMFAACDKNDADNDKAKNTTEAQTQAQNKKPSNNNTPSPAVTTVSVAKWKNAFNISRFDSFTFASTEKYTYTNETEELELKIKYNDGVMCVEYIEKETFEGGSDEYKESFYRKGMFEDFVDLDAEWLEELIFMLEDYDDFGYSLFTYSESTKAYSAAIVEDESTIKVNIWFSNNNIVKITVNGKHDDGIEIVGNYQFSKLDSTEKVVIPTKEINHLVTQAKTDIMTATRAESYGISASPDATLTMVQNFMANIEVGDITYIALEEGKIYYFEYDCDKTTLSCGSHTITFDSVHLRFYDGKLSYIEFDDTNNYNYIFYIEYDYYL